MECGRCARLQGDWLFDFGAFPSSARQGRQTECRRFSANGRFISTFTPSGISTAWSVGWMSEGLGADAGRGLYFTRGLTLIYGFGPDDAPAVGEAARRRARTGLKTPEGFDAAKVLQARV